MSIILSLPEILRLEHREGVAWLQFDSPSSRNAVNGALAHALCSLVKSTNGSPSPLEMFIAENECGAFCLTSALNDIFMSGGDIKNLAQLSTQEAYAFTQHMRVFAESLRTISVPTFCVLSGAAYGGGAELSLAVDFRFVTPTASLNFWQAKWGVPGGWHGMRRLQEIVPGWDSRKVSLLFACSQSLGAEALIRSGIADGLFDTAESASNAVIKMAQEYKNCSDILKRSLLSRSSSTALNRDDMDFAIFSHHWLNAEHSQRLSLFVEKASHSRKERHSL